MCLCCTYYVFQHASLCTCILVYKASWAVYKETSALIVTSHTSSATRGHACPSARVRVSETLWNDGGLKALSARVVRAAPNDDSANSMRALVLLGEPAGTWEAGPRSAVELREAATHFERGAALCTDPAHTAQRTDLAKRCRSQAELLPPGVACRAILVGLPC